MRSTSLALLLCVAACGSSSSDGGDAAGDGTDGDGTSTDADGGGDGPGDAGGGGDGANDGPDDGSAGDGADGFDPGPSACTAMALEENVSLSGYASDRYAWSDAQCARRTAALVRNDASDPGGSAGGYLRELTWEAGGTTRTAIGSGGGGWNGFGYVVNHYGDTADTSIGRTGTHRVVLAGAHHGIHEFTIAMSPGGPVTATVHWFFATGRSAPIYAITFDASAAAADQINADTRAPYGDLLFEGEFTDIGGIGWGDGYRFVTTGTGAVTTATSWDYTASNVVPYVQMWSASIDAEMGLVQTQAFEQNVAAGDYGGGLLQSDCWGKTSDDRGANCSPSGETMPHSWLWPYQLNQYELPFTTNSHRVAWGSSYGAIGQSSVSSLGRTLSGYPRVSYAVYVVIDPHSGDPTLALATEVERALGATLSASEGTVVSEGAAGPGRTDNTTYEPAGYNPAYGVWELTAAATGVTATLDPRAGALVRPIFHVRDFAAASLSEVTLDGAALDEDGYFATLDTERKELWLTLNGTVSKAVTLRVR